MFPPLSLAVGGLGDGPLLSLLDAAAGLRVRLVEIDVTRAGVRPRDLDRSGRRDMAAQLRRRGLELSGMELPIPPEHFADAATVDRAVAALLAAIDLAAEIGRLNAGTPAVPGRLSVGVTLPNAIEAAARLAIEQQARSRGVAVADFAWPPGEARPGEDGRSLGVGIDPAAVLTAGDDPVRWASTFVERVAGARLTDLSRRSVGVRSVPGAGDGRLDVLAFAAALGIGGYTGALTLDVRGLADPVSAVRGLMLTLDGLPARP